MKKVITEKDIIDLAAKGSKIILLTPNDILTPSAIDKIKSLGLTTGNREEAEKIEAAKYTSAKINHFNRVVIASDHTGFKIKNIIAKFLSDKDYTVTDVGAFDENSSDYPDFAYAAAQKVKNDEADIGIIFDATGIPSAIAANKVKGIRAAACYNEFSARSSREHNNANILVLGAKTLGEETIKSIIEVWLTTRFGGGRHQRRINKIIEIETKESGK